MAEVSNEEMRTDALAALKLHAMPEPQLEEALDAVRSMGDERLRAQALDALVSRLPESELGHALDSARSIGDERLRVAALSTVAIRLSEPLLGELLGLARSIGDELQKTELLAALAARLSELGRTDEAFGIAMEIMEKWPFHLYSAEMMPFARHVLKEGISPWEFS